MINPEKSCIRDVNAAEAARLKKCGFTEYCEEENKAEQEAPAKAKSKSPKKAGKKK